jgi:hypothetical protein
VAVPENLSNRLAMAGGLHMLKLNPIILFVVATNRSSPLSSGIHFPHDLTCPQNDHLEIDQGNIPPAPISAAMVMVN